MTFKIFYPTLFRDLSHLFLLRRFWGFIALWSAICASLFFFYLDDFMNIQPILRAKNSHYGVSDLVLIPYLKTTGYVTTLFIASCCSKLYYHEQFLPFSQLYKTLQPSPLALIGAKCTYVFLLSFLTLFLISLPVWGSGLFFSYNTERLVLLLLGLLVLFFSAGVVAMSFSQYFSHSVLVVLATVCFFMLPVLASKLWVDPAWIIPVIAYFSPFSHINHIANGVISISDLIFFVHLLALFFILSFRQFRNSHFFNR